MHNRVSAVFDSAREAERAIDDLRRQGVSDEAISLIARHEEGGVAPEHVEEELGADEEAERDTAGKRAGRGALAGGGVGALFGLAASLIPGVGPFITAGWLATALGAVGGGVAAGAIVGGTAGAVAGALSKAGYERDEAEYYGKSIEEGKYFVAIDTDKTRVPHDEIRDTLSSNGGHYAPRYGDRAA